MGRVVGRRFDVPVQSGPGQDPLRTCRLLILGCKECCPDSTSLLHLSCGQLPRGGRSKTCLAHPGVAWPSWTWQRSSRYLQITCIGARPQGDAVMEDVAVHCTWHYFTVHSYHQLRLS